MTGVMHERGPVAPMRLGHLRTLLLSDPEQIEVVLGQRNAEFGKHHLPRLGGPLLGNGLFTSTGNLWRRERKLVQPAFHRQRIREYSEVMVGYAAELARSWRDGEVRDLDAEMMRLTLRIVARTLFDADVDGQAVAVGEAMETVRRCFVARLDGLVPVPARVPTPTNRRLARAVRELDAVVYRIIDERRRSRINRGDLLSLLLAAQDEDGAGMSDRQLRDEVMTLFIGGHETTSLGLTWTWHLLAAHPERQRELVIELREVLGDRRPTVDDLPRLEHVERAIRESMRLFPPVYVFDRLALRDCVIGDRAVRSGTVVLISPWVVHRRGDLYEAPDEFRPQRWQDPASATLPKYAYLPFGGGPRVCIGNRFAQMEMGLVIATMLQEIALSPAGTCSPIPEASITLRPRGGLPLVIGRRQKPGRPTPRVSAG
jgi:cytochrome P450